MLQGTATLLGGSKHRKSCNAPPHFFGALDREHLQRNTTLLGCKGLWKSCNAPPHYVWAMAAEVA